MLLVGCQGQDCCTVCCLITIVWTQYIRQVKSYRSEDVSLTATQEMAFYVVLTGDIFIYHCGNSPNCRAPRLPSIRAWQQSARASIMLSLWDWYWILHRDHLQWCAVEHGEPHVCHRPVVHTRNRAVQSAGWDTINYILSRVFLKKGDLFLEGDICLV